MGDPRTFGIDRIRPIQPLGLSDDEEDALISDVTRDVLGDAGGLADEPTIPTTHIGDSSSIVDPFAETSRSRPRMMEAPAAFRSAPREEDLFRVTESTAPGWAGGDPTPDDDEEDFFSRREGDAPAGLADDSPFDLATPPPRRSPTAAVPPPPGLADEPEEPLYSAEELDRLDRAKRQDRRRKIGTAVMQAIGFGTTLAGAGSGSFGLADLGVGLTGIAGGIPRDRQAMARNDIMRDRAMRERQQDRASARSAQAAEQARLAVQDQRAGEALDLRQQQAASDMELDAARRDAIIAEQAQTEMDRAMAEGDADAQRAAFRSLVNGLNDDSGFVQEMRSFANSPAFENASSDTLSDYAARITQIASGKHSGLIERGGSRSGGWTVDETGRTVYRGGGGTRQVPARPAAPGAAPVPANQFDDIGPTPVVPPAAAVAPTGPRRPGPARAAPPTAGPTGAPPPTGTAREGYVNTDALAAMQRAVGERLSSAEFNALMHEARVAGLTPAQIDSQAGHLLMRARLQTYRDAPAAERARIQDRIADSAAASLRGELELPPGVDRSDYNAVAPRMTATYEEGVRPFDSVVSALDAARTARLDDYQIRLAIHAGSGDASALRALQAEATTTPEARRLAQRVAYVREMYGRDRSGAAISPMEWGNFERILGMNSTFSSPDTLRSAMRNLRELGMELVRGRAANRTSDADALYQFWRQNQLSGAGARRRTAPARSER